MKDIILKKIERHDIELIRKWRNDKDVSQYMYNEDYISELDQVKWFDSIAKSNNSIYWMIEYEGKNIGLASITEISKSLQSCFWAFYIGDMTYRGAGVGAKVEYKIIEYVFSDLKLNKLRCEVFVFNDKVIKLHEKFGFRREAYYREHCIKGKIKLDVIGLALLKSDWDSLKENLKSKIYRK